RAEAMQAGEKDALDEQIELSVAQVYRMSDFCPCPRGDARTDSRFYDAIRGGCIPVVFDRLRMSAYENDVEYDKFVVIADWVNDDYDMLKLIEELSAMTLEQKALRRLAMLHATPFLTWSSEDMVPNAFERAFHELACRARIARPFRQHFRFNEPFPDGKSTNSFLRDLEAPFKRIGKLHFTSLAEGSETCDEPEPESATHALTVIFVEDMDSDSAKSTSYLGKLPKYTGTKDEDRPRFVQDFSIVVERVRRHHGANIRQRLRSATGTQMTDEQRNTQPDWQTVCDLIPSLLAGESNQIVASPVYSWWEMLVHACKAVSDEALRQFIKECVSHLRIERVQVRLLGGTATWVGPGGDSDHDQGPRAKNVADKGAAGSGDGSAGKQQPEHAQTKKANKEVNNAERVKKPYSKVPPPAEK
ncbi:hypothetical protein CYMTET_26102, partial [Cymbomonas tetramitiformis]